MRKTLTLVAILAVVGAGAYLFLFHRGTIKTKVKEMVQEARGFDTAKTPQRSIDLFREAIQQRDYETAAKYCTPEYAEQMRKAAPAASKLGKKIDDLREAMNKRSLTSDTSRAALSLLEPFPPDFVLVELKHKEGDDKAYAIIGEKVDPELAKSHILQWKFDLLLCRSLTKSLPLNPIRIELKREGEGEGQYWRLNLPVNGALRQSVDQLNKKHMDYYNALEKIDLEIKNEPTTKQDVDSRLKTELERVLD